MSRFLQPMFETLHRVITKPWDEMTRWQRAARWLYDFCRYGGRQLVEDDAPGLAAALSFRMLFGLLPLLAVATVTAKAFIGDRLPAVVNRVVELLGADEVRVMSADGGAASIPLGNWLESMVGEASNVNLAALGWVGALVLVYSAISLMVTIENSFNRVVRAPSGRPWLKRIPLYWFVLTLGPILLGVTLYLESRYTTAVTSIASLGWLVAGTRVLWNLALIWALMFALYFWVPNTSMRMRPAAIGALVAAILLETGKRFFGAYLENAFSTSRLYGSLGLVPLFMMWVYLTWLAVLFGLEVTAMVQSLHGRRMAELEGNRPKNELVDASSVLVVMEAIGNGFHHGHPTTGSSIASETGIPESVVSRMLERLLARGFIHRVSQSDGAYSLARPAESIPASEVMAVGWELTDDGMRPLQGLRSRLREVQANLAATTTLAELVPAVAGEQPVAVPSRRTSHVP